MSGTGPPTVGPVTASPDTRVIPSCQAHGGLAESVVADAAIGSVHSTQAGEAAADWVGTGSAAVGRGGIPASRTARPAAGAPGLASDSWPAIALTGLLDRARSDGVTGPALVAVGAAAMACGIGFDLGSGVTAGAGTGLAFLLVAVAGPAVVRARSLATAVVTPPLLFAGAVATIARAGGANRGSREVVLDIGTTLALSAPLLFAGTLLAAAVAVTRLGLRARTRRQRRRLLPA